MNAVEEYLESTRQWWRVHRIAHAKYNLGIAAADKNESAMEFWTEVLGALEG